MNLQTLNFALALPEIIIASMASVILMLGVFIKHARGQNVCFWLSIGSLLVVAALIIGDFSTRSATAFNGLFVDDPMSDLLKIAICILSAAIFIYSRQYNEHRGIFQNEYYVLGLFSVCGMMVMASANHLLTLYLGLELMSLCLYSMIAFYRDDALAVESAMKYFVLGALASSILLYGMSLLYGLTGTLNLNEMSVAVASVPQNNLALILATVFVVVALGFKLGAVPFHMWVPDVYHGSPTSTTAFISAAPKIAAFAIIMRLLVGGLEDLQGMWQQMLIILALLSIMVGNIIAIAQDNLKRMLAYSTISHMGFFLLGILSGTDEGYGASLFYVLVYATMSCAAFGLVLYLSDKNFESDQLNDLKGMSKRSPLLALFILILMFSMAGVPPAAGFFAKLSVIQALVNADLVWIAIVAVILAVIGAYYYLRIIKLVYFDAPQSDRVILRKRDSQAVLAFNVIIIVAILPWIGSLISLCNQVVLKFAH